MRKWAVCFSFAVLVLSGEVFAQRRPGPRDPFETAQACAQVFKYQYQQQECQKKALDSDIVYGCGRFGYDYQKMDCIGKAQSRGGGVSACYDAFQYDYQRFDCLQIPANGRKVIACTTGFNYDYQRFDCLKTPSSGAQAEFCVQQYKYDYQKFDCLKKAGPLY